MKHRKVECDDNYDPKFKQLCKEDNVSSTLTYKGYYRIEVLSIRGDRRQAIDSLIKHNQEAAILIPVRLYLKTNGFSLSKDKKYYVKGAV